MCAEVIKNFKKLKYFFVVKAARKFLQTFVYYFKIMKFLWLLINLVGKVFKYYYKFYWKFTKANLKPKEYWIEKSPTTILSYAIFIDECRWGWSHESQIKKSLTQILFFAEFILFCFILANHSKLVEVTLRVLLEFVI